MQTLSDDKTSQPQALTTALDPLGEAQAQSGLGAIDDPVLQRAALHVRRALVAHRGMPSRSWWTHWIHEAAFRFGVDPQALRWASGSLWQAKHRVPPQPDGRPLSRESDDPSVFVREVKDGGVELRARAGTKDAERSLLLAVAALVLGGVGWLTNWGFAAQYLAPIGGLLLFLWSFQRYRRRQRKWVLFATPSTLKIGSQHFEREGIAYLNVVQVGPEGAQKRDDSMPASLRPFERVARPYEAVVTVGTKAPGPGEDTEKPLAGPLDEATAHTLVHLLEAQLRL